MRIAKATKELLVNFIAQPIAHILSISSCPHNFVLKLKG